MFDISEAITKITTESAGKDLYIIGISGFGGSGKSTLARELADRLGNCNIVSIDSFSSQFPWRRDSDWSNFNRKRLIEEVIDPAKKNIWPIIYDSAFWPGVKAEITISLEKKMFQIVEGCSIFHPETVSYFDFKIWINLSLELATKFGKNRDLLKDNNTEIADIWDNLFMPNDRDFFNKYRPDGAADIFIDNKI
ncbi:MAG: hypothetical protein NT141_02150 [candidate division WWE3 bacterium]|nr:hypothetical protein [candidate division WWE3 bacterium]